MCGAAWTGGWEQAPAQVPTQRRPDFSSSGLGSEQRPGACRCGLSSHSTSEPNKPTSKQSKTTGGPSPASLTCSSSLIYLHWHQERVCPRLTCPTPACSSLRLRAVCIILSNVQSHIPNNHTKLPDTEYTFHLIFPGKYNTVVSELASDFTTRWQLQGMFSG